MSIIIVPVVTVKSYNTVTANIMIVKVELISEPVESIYEFNSWAYGTLSSGKSASDGSNQKGEQLTSRSQRTNGFIDALPDFLFHLQMFNRPVPPKALLEFVNLEPNNTPQALDYLQRYGIFNLEDLEQRDEHPKEVKKFWRESINRGFIPFATPMPYFWKIHGEIANILTLLRAISNRDSSLAKPSCIRLLEPMWDAANYKRDWLQYAKLVIRHHLTPELKNVKFGISEIDGKLAATVASYGLCTALHLLVVDRIANDTPLAQCQNKHCNKLFLITRSTKKFCSRKCQELIKVHRFRGKITN